MREELEGAHVVSTGGLAELISPACEEIDSVEKNLTLEGMRLIYVRLKKWIRHSDAIPMPMPKP